MTNTTLLSNVTSAIASAFTGTIGTSNDSAIGMYIVGIIVLAIFMYWIFSSGVGLWGLIIIIPPLILIMTGLPGQEQNSLGLLPTWASGIVVLIIGVVFGLIMLRVFREG